MSAARLSTETHGDVVVVQTPPELTEAKAAELTAGVRDLVAAGRTRMVFRLDRTAEVDGAGLTALLDARDAVLAAAGAVSVTGLAGHCASAFRVTRLDRQFEVRGDLVAAVKAVR